MATQFNKRMKEEMELRGLHSTTKYSYIHAMRELISYFKKQPDELDVKDLKRYQYHLIKERKLSPNTVNSRMSGIRFFYRVVLERYWYMDLLPRVKSRKSNPVILTEEEVARMIQAVDSLLYKAIIMLTYSSGLRQSEVRNLKIQDIDSDRLVLNIRDGKGGYDRLARLSPVTLKYLRSYWKHYRLNKKKSDWLFVATKDSYSGKKGLSHTALGYVFNLAAKAAGVKKKFTPISFATALGLIY